MGLCGSKQAAHDPNEIDADERAKQAAAQRRRLSVAPQHVGDTSGDQAKPDAASVDPSAAEAEAKADGGRDNVVMLSKRGFVPYNRNKVNQDRANEAYGLGGQPEVALYMVCDGHGEFGHLVAQFVKEKLEVYLSREGGRLVKDPKGSILSAVAGMVKELAATNINIAFSGTTLVFGLRVRSGGKDTLYVANIGDSRCVMGLKPDGVKDLSEDQKPENPKEKARILKAGGRVEPLPGPPDEDCGPMRVWLAEVDVPGLAMSRSIGDEVSQTVGVISVPEITTHEINPETDDFLILASDGVWEFISSEEAVNIVRANRDNIKAAASNLVAESVKRWQAAEEVVDDTTCVIVKI